MLDWLLIGVAFFVLCAGTYTDCRTREVPDWINFTGIAAGLGLRALWSALYLDASALLEGLFGFGAGIAFAYSMFYLGQWGGGDSKMLMALGALLGLRFELSHISIAFIVNLVIAGGLYGLGWTTVLTIRNWRKLHAPLRKSMAKTKKPALLIAVPSVAFVIAASALPEVRLPLLGLALLFPVTLYLSAFVRAVEKTCMQRAVTPDALTEGDWVVREIIVGKRRICGPKDLGLSLAQIRTLKRLHARGKIKRVLIKLGLPFMPAFLAAFLMALAWGNPLLALL